VGCGCEGRANRRRSRSVEIRKLRRGPLREAENWGGSGRARMPQLGHQCHTLAMGGTLLIIDDDEPSCRLVRATFQSEGVSVLAAHDGPAGLERIETDRPDVVLLDIHLPSASGIDLLEHLKKTNPSLPIVMLTASREIKTAVRATRLGAFDYLTKPIDDDALLTAIRSALKRSEAALDEQAELQVLRDCYAALTPREREVMRQVASGMLNKQIGLKLDISEITVKAHRGKMMQKMKADSIADLVKMAVRLGLTPARNPWHISRDH